MDLNLEDELASMKLCVTGGKSVHQMIISKSGNSEVPSLMTPKYSIPVQKEPCYSNVLYHKDPLKPPIYSNVVQNCNSDKHDRVHETNTSTPEKNHLVYSNISHIRQPPALYSNINAFSNTHTYANIDCHSRDFPPPPPPVTNIDESISSVFPSNEDYKYPPPPSSPVSSSYSELRRTNDCCDVSGPDYISDCSNYAPLSRTSSTYESIYEPINPRPPSKMSSRSNYSMYGSGSTIAQRRLPTTLNNVTSYSDVAVHSEIEPPIDDNDTLGICSKCNLKIIGEGSGCTAINKMYHIKCFTCYHCDTLLQGKTFYQLDGQPCCEQDYLETKEKCSRCQKPILDRTLRATGRPYHPECFICVVCHKNMNGIVFTVDTSNQIHCIKDFHEKFAPRCCGCKLPIISEPGKHETVRTVVLDKSFHIECYKCEDCGLVLSSESSGGCYPLDDHILCKSCNAKRVQELTSGITLTTEL